jgi:flavin-dependent dehydrogenase
VPAIRRVSWDFGVTTIAGFAVPSDGVLETFAPRRPILDGILASAATVAGAELRHGVVVEALLRDGDRVVGVRAHTQDGASFEERAAIVIGADGRRSVVAREVAPAATEVRAPLTSQRYAFFRDVPTDGLELVSRPGRGLAAGPTHDGLTLAGIATLAADPLPHEAQAFLDGFEASPAFAARLRAGHRESPIYGTDELPTYLRRAHGPGWALVGDAGYHKDPITAQGIADALLQAADLAEALHGGLGGRGLLEDALDGYERRRDARAHPACSFTALLASLTPVSPSMGRLLGRIAEDRDESNQFVAVCGGMLAAEELFGFDPSSSA